RPRTNIDHGSYAENREKALVRLGSGRSTSEEHPPTNLLAVAAIVATGRVAADVAKVEDSDLRHSTFCGDDSIATAALDAKVMATCWIEAGPRHHRTSGGLCDRVFDLLRARALEYFHLVDRAGGRPIDLEAAACAGHGCSNHGTLLTDRLSAQ